MNDTQPAPTLNESSPGVQSRRYSLIYIQEPDPGPSVYSFSPMAMLELISEDGKVPAGLTKMIESNFLPLTRDQYDAGIEAGKTGIAAPLTAWEITARVVEYPEATRAELREVEAELRRLSDAYSATLFPPDYEGDPAVGERYNADAAPLNARRATLLAPGTSP